MDDTTNENSGTDDNDGTTASGVNAHGSTQEEPSQQAHHDPETEEDTASGGPA